MLYNLYTLTLCLGFVLGVYVWNKLGGLMQGTPKVKVGKEVGVQKDGEEEDEGAEEEIAELSEALGEYQVEVAKLRGEKREMRELLIEKEGEVDELHSRLAEMTSKLVSVEYTPPTSSLFITAPTPLSATEIFPEVFPLSTPPTPPSLASSAPSSTPSSPNSRNALINNAEDKVRELRAKLQAARRM